MVYLSRETVEYKGPPRPGLRDGPFIARTSSAGW